MSAKARRKGERKKGELGNKVPSSSQLKIARRQAYTIRSYSPNARESAGSCLYLSAERVDRSYRAQSITRGI